MFNVIISSGNHQWQFSFDVYARATEIIKLYKSAKETSSDFYFQDQYGTEAILNPHQISGILIEDLNRCGDAAIERSLYQARAQAKGNTKAMNDPLLKLSAPMGMPGMNGGQRRPF